MRKIGTGVDVGVRVTDADRVRVGDPATRSAVAVNRSFNTNCVVLRAMPVRIRFACCIVRVAPTSTVHTGSAIVGINVWVRVDVRDMATTVCVCPVSGVVGSLRPYNPTL